MDTTIIVALIAALSSGGICSLITYLIQRKDKRTEQERQLSIDKLISFERLIEAQDERIKKLEKATIAQMHDTIYSKCEVILTEYANGRRTCIDVDEFHNLNVLYEAYAEMGGNGTGEFYFSRIKREIPLKQTNQTARTP